MTFLNHTITARPLSKAFVWNRQVDPTTLPYSGSRYFYEEGSGPSDALRPLFEGRRMMLSVQTPGWGAQDVNLSTRNKTAMAIIDQYLSKYDIESVGGLHPFYGDKKGNPRLLCFIDFKTKAGADQAVAEVHDTEIEGRRTWIQPSAPAPWRAHQIGKVDKALLAELQEKGLASRETYNDKFITPIVDGDSKKKKTKKSKVSVKDA
ncbi:Nn.00g062240.m01.CDS01 [Neocucurbitaria sp. VM-36]